MDLSIEDVEATGMKKESRDPWIPNFTSVPFTEKDYMGSSFDYAVDVPSPILTIDLCSSPVDAEIACPKTLVATPQKDQYPCDRDNSPENLSSPISSAISPNDEKENWSNPALEKALRDRHNKDSSGSSRSRLRTPRTLTRLMQQHRENERHRHRGLNASIKEISKRIPGYEEAANETKIVKLQRIINYICHLEEHIQGICGDIGLDLDFKHLFLSPNIQKPAESKRHQVPPAKQQSSAAPGISVVSSTVATPKRRKFQSLQTKNISPRQPRNDATKRMKISSPTVDSTTADSICKRGHSQRRCQQARYLKEACSCAAQVKPHNNLDGPDTENDSDATLEEVCQALQQAGNITPEIEKSLEWLGHISASPDSSLFVCDDYSLNTLDLQQSIPEEQAQEIFTLCSSDWLKDTECINMIPVVGKEKSPGKDANVLTIHSYARLTPEKGAQQTWWNGDPNTLKHGQVIKLEAQRRDDSPEVIYISDSPVYDTDSQGSIICQFPENMEVAEQCEISDSPPSPVKSEGGRSLDLNMMGNLNTSKCQITDISPVHNDCPVERNKRKANTPQRILPFAMYTMVVESDSCGSFPSLSEEENITHCQFQGIQCLEENRRLLQKQKERELALAAQAAAVELDEADIAEAITALKSPPYQSVDEMSSQSTIRLSPPSETSVKELQYSSNNSDGKYLPIIDHRKTSWMNGFMMYSRIHRREYIEKHPGVHTSYISKLMGQDWRKLKPEEQEPYRKKAKDYVKNYLAPFNTPFDYENDT